MTTILNELRGRKTQLARECQNLLNEKGSTPWTKEDQASFDEKTDTMSRLDKQIDAHMNMLQQDAERNHTDLNEFRVNGSEGSGKGGLTPQAKAARETMERFVRNGWNALSQDEVRAVRSIQNAQSVGTPSQGGYTVQTDISREWVDQMAAFGGMRQLATQLVTSAGNPISIPTSDGTAEEGEIVAENASAASQDVAFGTVALNVFKFSSKVIALPYELLQDSSIDILAMINKRFRNRIGRAQNRKFSVGAGTTEPLGIVTASSVGKTAATGNTTTLTYDDLVDLVDSVDYAYTEGDMTPAFMMHQQTRKVVRKLKDTQGRPIWTPNWDEGITGLPGDTLLGYNLVLNNQMAQPGANNKTITFGAHGKYTIRDVMDIVILRFDDSVYASKGQVGFLAWARSGGNLTDNFAVKTFQHSAT